MARPSIDPRVRYMNEIKIWKVAELTGGAVYVCNTHNEAVHKMHRLHMCRKSLRDEMGIGAHGWDAFKVQLHEATVSIVPTTPLDLGRFLDKDGRPIPAEKIARMLAEDERPMTDDEVRKAVGLLEKDKDIVNAQKLHFDPNKPLDLE